MRDHYISYPKSKKANEVVFMLNSDDYSKEDADKVSKSMKAFGWDFKRTKRYSKAKLMSWYVFSLYFLEDKNWDDCKYFAERELKTAL